MRVRAALHEAHEPHGAPMSTAPEALDADGVAEWITQNGVAPEAAAGCAARVVDSTRWQIEHGGAEGRFFDLASLTKPMTAVAAARSGIDRRTPLGAVLPELAESASGAVPLEMFLAHRAGLEAHAALFEPLTRGERIDRRQALRAAADGRRRDALGAPPPGGFPPLYSDLGYALAGEAVARAVGAADAGEAIDRLVVEPLGLGAELGTARSLAARGIDLAREAAPTEDVPWRGGVVRGRVHDENAWALTGDGGSGHAGMFGTVRAVLAFGRAVLDALDPQVFALSPAPFQRSPLFSPSLAWLVAPRAGGTLLAGFDAKSPEGSSAGALAGPRTFGHLGFTGTSLWIDPDARAVVALLTNRVHPTRDHVALRAVRPRVHDALFARARTLAAHARDSTG
jgi:CubicO group peptidase (beta-lactamase class C family)